MVFSHEGQEVAQRNNLREIEGVPDLTHTYAANSKNL
jgi:hypothetical protein